MSNAILREWAEDLEPEHPDDSGCLTEAAEEIRREGSETRHVWPEPLLVAVFASILLTTEASC